MLVANTIFIRIVDANAITVLTFTQWVFAGGIQGNRNAVSSNGQVDLHKIGVVPFRENLNVQVAREHTIGGELSQQYGPVHFGEAIDIAIQDVPNAADFVVHDNVAS